MKKVPKPSRREAIALFRSRVIGDLHDRDLTRGELKRELQQRAKERYRPPGRTLTRTYNWKTLQSWYYASKKDVVAGLLPQSRARGHALALNAEQRKLLMTVADLMTMSSGLACDDNDPDSPGHEDRLDPEIVGRDFTRHIVDLPMAGAPGSHAVYCSAGMVLLAPIVEQTTGRWSVDLVQEWFARPLDIPTYHLNLTPTLQAYFGGGIHLRPRDMAKLGQVFVNNGTWRGRPIVSGAWVNAALERRARINEQAVNDYGYGWWRRSYAFEGQEIEAFYASGNGGQLIFGFPALEAVVTFTAGNYANVPTWRAFMDEIVPKFVLPALLSRSSGELQ